MVVEQSALGRDDEGVVHCCIDDVWWQGDDRLRLAELSAGVSVAHGVHELTHEWVLDGCVMAS